MLNCANTRGSTMSVPHRPVDPVGSCACAAGAITPIAMTTDATTETSFLFSDFMKNTHVLISYSIGIPYAFMKFGKCYLRSQ